MAITVVAASTVLVPVAALAAGAGGIRTAPLQWLRAPAGTSTEICRGEAVELRWEDVDFVSGLLRVTQQVVQLGWATDIRDPEVGQRSVWQKPAEEAEMKIGDCERR